jgi:hypothetical protein
MISVVLRQIAQWVDIEEKCMRSKHQKRRMSVTEIALTARGRERIAATPRTTMTGGVGLGVLILLFLASVAYVAFGGTLAFEASSGQPETSIATDAAKSADAAGAPRNEKASSGSASSSV